MSRPENGRLRPWHIGVLCALPYLAYFLYLVHQSLKIPGTDALIFAFIAGVPLTGLLTPIALLVGIDSPWQGPLQWVLTGVLGSLNWGLFGAWVSYEKYFRPRRMRAAEDSAAEETDGARPGA